MHRWFPSAALLGLLAAGCATSVEPALLPGDVVRPEVAFAPKDPWPAGARVTLGLLVWRDRPGGESRYLRDEEVAADSVMLARVTFLDGDRPLDDPLEVPFVRDC